MNSWWGCFRPPWGGTLDVENILLRLLQAADFDVERAEHGIIYDDRQAAHQLGDDAVFQDVVGLALVEDLAQVQRASGAPPERKRGRE